jgi:hypothetical protein
MQHFGKSNRFGVPAPKPGTLPTGPHPEIFTAVLYTICFKKAIGKLLFALMGGLWYAFGKVDIRGAVSDFALLAISQL